MVVLIFKLEWWTKHDGVRLHKLGVSTAHVGELVWGAASAFDGLVRASGFNKEFGCFLKNPLFCCLSGVCFGFASPLTLVNFTLCVVSVAWRQSQNELYERLYLWDYHTLALVIHLLGWRPRTWYVCVLTRVWTCCATRALVRRLCRQVSCIIGRITVFNHCGDLGYKPLIYTRRHLVSLLFTVV